MTKQQILDLYFLDARHKLVELAAFLDRVERADGRDDFRLKAFRDALITLHGKKKNKAKDILIAFSDPTTKPIAAATTKAAYGAFPGSALTRLSTINYRLSANMRYIEPHAHMVSRTTDDYERMALAGCEAVCEPAFWAGFDRSSPAGFFDYFSQLTEHEPKRAAKFGLKHFCWLCINSKEAEDVKLAEEVIALVPKFLNQPNVLGIGEIGLNKNSKNELRVLEMQVELAAKHNQLILVHTPHLEDKLKGTKLILDVLKNDKRIRPERVIIDHVEEHTVEMVLDAGMWAGMTLYPETKCTPARAIDILETYGHERLWLNSACDWGISDPLAVPKTALEMKRRGHLAKAIDRRDFSKSKIVSETKQEFRRVKSGFVLNTLIS